MKKLIFISLMVLSHQVFANEMENLLLTCAPDVHPQTMGAIVSHESRGNFLIIGDNGDWGKPKKERIYRTFYPASVDEAVQTASSLIHAGHVIDIGLGQLNNRNLARLNMTLYDAFEPCKNLWGASRVLVEFYLNAAKRYGPGREALYAAISAYNTGSFINGFKNGYVQKVVTAGVYVVPRLNMGTPKQRMKSVHASRSTTGSKTSITQFDLAQVKNAPGYVSGWEN